MNQKRSLKTWGKDWWCCFSGAKCSDAFLFKKLLRNTFDSLNNSDYLSQTHRCSCFGWFRNAERCWCRSVVYLEMLSVPWDNFIWFWIAYWIAGVYLQCLFFYTLLFTCKEKLDLWVCRKFQSVGDTVGYAIRKVKIFSYQCKTTQQR